MSYKELKAEKVALDLKIIAVVDRMTAAKRQAQRELPLGKYKWIPTVVIVESKNRFNDIPAGTTVIMFEGRLENSHVYDDHFALYGEITNRPCLKLESRRYWRKNKVLIAQGGGYSLLIPYGILDDDAWEQLKAGNIPDELLHSNLQDDD